MDWLIENAVDLVTLAAVIWAYVDLGMGQNNLRKALARRIDSLERQSTD